MCLGVSNGSRSSLRGVLPSPLPKIPRCLPAEAREGFLCGLAVCEKMGRRGEAQLEKTLTSPWEKSFSCRKKIIADEHFVSIWFFFVHKSKEKKGICFQFPGGGSASGQNRLDREKTSSPEFLPHFCRPSFPKYEGPFRVGVTRRRRRLTPHSPFVNVMMDSHRCRRRS